MVNNSMQLDSIFHSLADPTRRDILLRVAEREFSIGELVEKYDISFVAVSKHLKVLEKAKLINKRKEGRKYIVAIEPNTLAEATDHLEQYRLRWQSSFRKLEKLLEEGE